VHVKAGPSVWDAETNDIPAGTASVSETVAAADGPLFVTVTVYVAFVPAVFAIASRFGPPLPAALITLLAVAWSLPNYFAGSVSWYNLFLASWGTLALLRHVETGRRRWLFLAGLCAGVSCLFKVTGLEFFAAALLFLVYREQESSAPVRGPAGTRRVTPFLLVRRVLHAVRSRRGCP